MQKLGLDLAVCLALHHALRLATRTRRLPWAELDALDVHTHLDDLIDHDHGWRHRADALRATLIPTDLDPDPHHQRQGSQTAAASLTLVRPLTLLPG